MESNDPQELADDLEREADRLEHEGEQVGEQVDAARRDWEAKKEDSSVPGAQPAEDDEDAAGDGAS